jgi:hypothetical protein
MWAIESIRLERKVRKRNDSKRLKWKPIGYFQLFC